MNASIIKQFRNKLMTLFVVSSICFSCTEKIYYISIETQKPATYMLPDSVSHFVVVNNAINQPADFANEVMIYGKNKERASINADSLTFYLGLGLYDILERNEFVPKVTYYSFDTKKGKNPLSVTPLSFEKRDSIFRETKGDVLISIDQFMVRSLLDIRMENATKWGLFATNPFVLFRVYLKGKMLPFVKQSFTDTLVWQTQTPGYDLNDVFAQLPIGRDALHETAYYFGEDIEKMLLPTWIEEERYFFIYGDAELKKGKALIENEEWEKASYLWTQLLEDDNLMIKGFVNHNLSVLSEINDDVDEAVARSKRALDAFKKKNKRNLQSMEEAYIKRLLQRKKERK